MQSRLPAFCNPVATHASTWDPTTAGLSVPLNIKLDGRIVPSPASPDGARVDFSHVVVLDGLFGEQERSGLWDILIGTPASSVTAFPAQQLAQAELADPSPSCTDSEQQQQQQQLRIPVQHDSIRNSARTIDDQLLLQPDLAQDMGTAGQPRSHLGRSPAFGSPQVPFTGRDDLRTLSNANIPSADRAHEPDNLMMPGPMMNGVRPLDTAAPMDVTVGRLNDGVSQIPPLDRWERRTADRAGLPGTWGLKPHMLDLLARGQIPAAVEVQTRLASLFPEFIVAHMPTDAIQTSTGTSSSNDTDSMPDAPGDNQTTSSDLPAGDGVCSKVHAPGFNFVLAEGHDTAGQPLGHDAAHQQQQQQQQGPTQEQMSGNLHNPSSPHRPPSSVSCDQSSAEAAVSSPAGHALETLELPSGVAKQALAAHHDPTEPSSPESAQRCESVGAPTCKAEDVAAEGQIPEVEESGHCSAFLGNAAVHGDTFQWHVDADPSDFAFPSPWMYIYGQYCNREPGQPLFVSLLLYLDADWPRDFAAETLFLDGDTDVGFAVRPKPYRAILMDQDVLHRVSAPSMLAGQRPRFSLVWKLLFYPRSSSTICSIARREWGPSACIGSAAKVQQVISSLAGKRKCTD